MKEIWVSKGKRENRTEGKRIKRRKIRGNKMKEQMERREKEEK